MKRYEVVDSDGERHELECNDEVQVVDGNSGMVSLIDPDCSPMLVYGMFFRPIFVKLLEWI